MLAALDGAPLGAVVVTAIERDGTLAGPDVDGLARVLRATALPVVASGGVGQADDLRALAAVDGSGRRRGAGRDGWPGRSSARHWSTGG